MKESNNHHFDAPNEDESFCDLTLRLTFVETNHSSKNYVILALVTVYGPLVQTQIDLLIVQMDVKHLPNRPVVANLRCTLKIYQELPSKYNIVFVHINPMIIKIVKNAE